MNVFKEISEVQELKENFNSHKDNVLDNFFKDPKKAKKLMLELIKLEKELDELEEEFKELQNEIS